MLLQVALIKAQIGALATCLMSLTHAGMAVDASSVLEVCAMNASTLGH